MAICSNGKCRRDEPVLYNGGLCRRCYNPAKEAERTNRAHNLMKRIKKTTQENSR